MTRRERRFNTWRPWVAGLALLIGLGASAALAQQQPAPGSAIEEPTVGIDTESADTAPGAAPVVPVSDEAPIPTSNLWEIITRGGLLMIPIAACSLILLAFVLERTISLRHGRVIPRPFVKRFLEQLRDRSLNQQRAAELCEENGSPVAEVFGGAVRKWGRPTDL